MKSGTGFGKRDGILAIGEEMEKRKEDERKPFVVCSAPSCDC